MAVDGYLNFNTKVNQKGFEAGIKKIKTSFSNIKSMLGGIAKVAGVAFGVRELIKFSKQAIETASDIQEVQNVVDVAFGNMAYKMEELADKAIQTYGISKLTAKQTGSTYMAMAKGMGIAEGKASDMAVTLTGLSADMASFYNKEQSVTATALNSVFTGETETLKQFGVVMTEANLQNFAYTQGIHKKISAMSQAEKVQLRYNYVMNQTALAQGDFARTSDGWANQTRILSEQWKEFSGTIGTILMNTILPAVRTLNNAMTWLNSSARKLLETLAAIFDWDISSNTASGFQQTSDAIGTSVDNQNALTDAVNETAKAQKRELMGFDKINKLSDDTASSNAGAGSSGVSSGSNSIPIDVDTSKADKKLTDLQQKIKDFVSSLKITFNDIFFKWKDLNGEQIAEKVIAGFGGLFGAATGFAIGGVPGAIVGTLVGVGLTTIFSSALFDHDGKIGAAEVAGMVALAAGALVGGAVVFEATGSLKGALIGASIGASLTMGIMSLMLEKDENGKVTTESLVESLIEVSTALIGAAVGVKIFKGKAGALLGMSVMAGLGLLINNLTFDNDGTIDKKEIVKLLNTVVLGITGGVLGLVLGKSGTAATLGFTIGTGLSFLINNLIIDNENVQNAVSDLGKAVVGIWNLVIDWVIQKAPFLDFLKKLKIPTDSESETVGKTIGGAISKGVSKGFNPDATIVTGPFVSSDAKKQYEATGKTVGSSIKGGISFGTLYSKVTSPLTNKDALTSYNTSGSKIATNIKSGISFVGINSKINSDLTSKDAKEKYSSSGSSAATSFKSGFKGKGFKDLYTSANNALYGKNTDYTGTGKLSANSFATGFQDGLDKKSFKGKVIMTAKDVELAKIASTLTFSKPREYAEGGFPEQGNLFIAQEAGPELVGRIGNRTAVANQDQIVMAVAAGVAQGVYEANEEQNALIKEQNSFTKNNSEILLSIKENLLNGLKSVINDITLNEAKKNTFPINDINSALDKASNMSLAGLKSICEKISFINIPQIPKLATGNSIPANYSEILSILREKRREPETVSSKNTIKEAVSEVVGNGNSSPIEVVVYLDSDVVYRNVVKKNRQETQMRGVNPLAG